MTGWTQVGNKCISDAEAAVIHTCLYSGGEWAGTECTCDKEGKHLIPNADGSACVCESDKYVAEYDAADAEKVVWCSPTAAYAAELAAVEAKKKCEESGGKYENDACTCDKETKHLVLDGDKCKCESADYEPRNGSLVYGCVVTNTAALRDLCNADAGQQSGAVWNEALEECVCPNNQRHIFSKDSGVCIENPKIIECEGIEGAYWNPDVVGDECQCRQAGYAVNKAHTKCIEDEKSLHARMLKEAQPKIANVQKLSQKLKATVAEFNNDRSVWKNKEGKFNTARLASDTVAGVVLGTAGALITSNVIKKNQIKNGMEDYQCVIGGQVVGGFGDQFRVGIQ